MPPTLYTKLTPAEIKERELAREVKIRASIARGVNMLKIGKKEQAEEVVEPEPESKLVIYDF